MPTGLKIALHVAVVIAVLLAPPLVYDAVSRSSLHDQQWALFSGGLGYVAYTWYWLSRIRRPAIKLVCRNVFAFVAVNIGALLVGENRGLEAASVFAPVATLLVLLCVAIILFALRLHARARLYLYSFLVLLIPGLALQYTLVVGLALEGMRGMRY
jgi:hypothetical protein